MASEIFTADDLYRLMAAVEKHQPEDWFFLDVRGCSACGQDHWLRVKRLLKGDPDSNRFDYRGECPVNGTPVFAREVQNDGQVSSAVQ